MLHLVDATSENAGEAYRIVRGELEAYGHDLTSKPEIVALSKADAATDEQIKEQIRRLKKTSKKTPLVLSAQTKQGVTEALRALLEVIDDARRRSGNEPKQKAQAWQP